METNENLLTAELHIDTIGYTHLKETAKWAKFLAIVGFVVSSLLIVVALFAGAFLANLGSGYGNANAVGAGMLSAVYILGGALYFFLSLYLFRFAVKMQSALASNDQENLNGSFQNLKIVYRIMGILMIIYIGIIILGLIAALGMAAMR